MTEDLDRPQTTTEDVSLPALVASIGDIWVDALGLKPGELDPDTSDFFELGGYSLLAMQVITRILERFQAHLPAETFDLESALLYTIFDEPTVRALAECLQADGINSGSAVS
jgi:acyl carrier protein